MAIITIKDLINKYREFPRKEKEIVGAALVKVNLGVAMPADYKRAAAFLKGSPYIAKLGSLDEVIHFLHHEGEPDPNVGDENSYDSISFPKTSPEDQKILEEETARDLKNSFLKD